MPSSLTGTVRLFRLNVRRDWLKIVLWVGMLAGLMSAAAGKFTGLYGTQAAMAAIAETLKTPAMVALFGPFTAEPPYQTAVLYGAEMMVFMGLFAAMMNIYFAVHSTRAAEENGTTELVLSRAIGRLSPLSAAILELLMINLVAGVLEAAGLLAANLPGADVSGSWLFGLGLGAFGWMFGTFSLLISQLVNSTRTATMFSYGWLGLLFVARMVTDVQAPNRSWWTIFGWIEQMSLYIDNSWLPVVMMLALSLAVLVATVAVARRRDIGAGLLEPRAGRAHASAFLRGPFTLLARVERTSTIGWIVGTALLGASFGSIFGTAGDLVKNNPQVAKLLGTGATNAANQTVVLAMSHTLTLVFAVIATIPVIALLLRLNSDERRGTLELLHAAPVSRLRLSSNYSVQAVLIGSASLFAGVLGMALAGQAVLTTNISVGRFLNGFVGAWPSVFLVGGFVALLVAFVPRWQVIAWALPVYGVLTTYLGGLFDLPDWAVKLTPYGWINDVPAKAVDWPAFALMTGLGLVLFVLAYVGYRRRDLTMN